VREEHVDETGLARLLDRLRSDGTAADLDLGLSAEERPEEAIIEGVIDSGCSARSLTEKRSAPFGVAFLAIRFLTNWRRTGIAASMALLLSTTRRRA
jgi:hypothetical protein